MKHSKGVITLVYTCDELLKVRWVMTFQVYDLIPFECLGDDNDAWFCPVNFGGL